MRLHKRDLIKALRPGFEAMIIALKRSKKLLLEVQLEKWVISWYHSKEVSQLPLINFIKYTPKESTGCIDQKWFVVAEVILRVTWLPIDKDRVYSLAAQSYWKNYWILFKAVLVTIFFLNWEGNNALSAEAIKRITW